MAKKLKGYRIRVTVDIPVWEFNKKKALEVAKKTVENCHSASKIMEVRCEREGLPDNRDLFPEDLNPSKREKVRLIIDWKNKNVREK